ncbi:MAG TPA: carbohydrate kinase [Pirellulales bacterium]
MKKPVVLALGEVLWDLFPDGERFGGAPANFACHAALLGADVAIASAVGDDARGRAAMDSLTRYGVDVKLVQTIEGAATGTVGITLDRNGKPTFIIHTNAAWDQVGWASELESLARNADAVYFGTLGQRSPDARETIRRTLDVARRAGVRRILDVNLRAPFYDPAMIRESIHQASLLKLSDDELPIVCDACGFPTVRAIGATLERLRTAYQLDCVAMTRGAEGAVLASSEGIAEQPGVPTIVRDTVGAGDSFTAAFLLGRLRSAPDEENLRNACEVAARVCAHDGAVPNM